MDSENLSIFAAFIFGLASFISPCVMPLIPAYLSFISGVSIDEMRNGENKKEINRLVALNSLLFIAGFTTVFVTLGASASYLGKLLQAHRSTLEKAGGTLVLLFGLHTMGILRIKFLYYERTFKFRRVSGGLLRSFLMGLAFAAGWTPCIGPNLSAILVLATKHDSLLQGIVLLFAYSLGLSVPFFLAGMGINTFLRFFSKLRKHFRVVEFCAGIMLIFLGVLLITDNLQSVLNKVLPLR